MLDYIEEKHEAGQLDLETIGGPWAQLRPGLRNIVEPAYPVVEQLIALLSQKIRTTDNLMANYLMKYFNLLTKQIIAIGPFARTRSWPMWLGIPVERELYRTDSLLLQLFESVGYSPEASNAFGGETAEGPV